MPVLPVRWRPAKPYCGQMNSFSCVSVSFQRGSSQPHSRLPLARESLHARGGRVLSPVKTPLLPGLTAGKTACHGPAAATAGFFLDLVKNSCVTSCMRIDESLGANVSPSSRKILRPSAHPVTSFRSILERLISPFSNVYNVN